MSSKHLIVAFLVFWLLLFAGAASGKPTVTVPGAVSGKPITTVRLGSAEGTFEIPLVVTDTTGGAPLTVDLLCASASEACRSILGRKAGSDAEFLSSFKLTTIPANGVVKLEFKADLPATESYNVVLRLSDAKGNASETLLQIARNRPAWDQDPDEAALKEVKAGPSGITSARIQANELANVDRDKITLRLSEFFDVENNDPGKVWFFDETTENQVHSTTLASLDPSIGTYTIKLDASELKPGKTYRGQLLFSVEGADSPPPLTLQIERIAGRNAELVVGQTLGQIETWGRTSIDIQLREKEGSVPIQGLKFDWGTLPAGDDRIAPTTDSFDMTLLVDGKAIPLWCGLNSRGKNAGENRCGEQVVADVPVNKTAQLRVSSECPDWFGENGLIGGKCLSPGKYRLPLVLWSDNSDRTKDLSVNVDFFVYRAWLIPAIVLAASIFVAYFMTRWKTNRDAADASLMRASRLLNAPELDLDRCALQPVVQVRADVERVQGAMKRERRGVWKKLLMSPAVTAEMNKRLDLIDKRVPQIRRFVTLWEAWRRDDQNPTVAHRVRKVLRETAQEMSKQMRSDGEFSATLGERLTLIESWSDRDRLQAAYIQRLHGAVRRLLNDLDVEGYSNENVGSPLLDALRAIDDGALKRLPTAMSDLENLAGQCNAPCQVPEHVTSTLQHWGPGGNGATHLQELLDAKRALAAAVADYGDNLEKVFPALEALETERNKDLWRELATLRDLGDLSGLDATLSKKVATALDASRAALSALSQIPPDRLQTSDTDVIRILRTRLQQALDEPPEDLDDAVQLDRDYYAPLKLIHERPAANRGGEKTSKLIDCLRKRLRIVRPAANELPQWLVEDVDVKALYRQVDDEAWTDLKTSGTQFTTPAEGDQFDAYQMIELEVIPGAVAGSERALLAKSFAFQHGFVYRWQVERAVEPKKPAKEAAPHSEALITREPMVQLYVPWEQAQCKISVQVYREESEIDVGEPIPAEVMVEAGKSALRRQNRLLFWQDVLNLVLVFLAAAFAGVATDQFTAAMHGSYTALFTLFTTGMALQQLRDWTFGSP